MKITLDGLLWADVPDPKRMSEAELKRCGGADDKKWLNKHVRLLTHPVCHAAVPWFGWKDKFAPCAMPTVNGHQFCAKHGGPRKMDPLEATRRKIARLSSQIEDRRYRVRSICDDITVLRKLRSVLEEELKSKKKKLDARKAEV